MAEKIIQLFKKKREAPAYQRLMEAERYYYLIPALAVMFAQWEYGFSIEDIISHSRLIFMPLDLLFPRADEHIVYNPYKALNHDIITVTDRDFEEERLGVVSQYEYWSKQKRIVLTGFHKSLIEAEKRALRKQIVMERIYDPELEDTQFHVIKTALYEEMRQILASWGIMGVSIVTIHAGLERVESAFHQADAMNYEVAFEKTFTRRLQKVA